MTNKSFLLISCDFKETSSCWTFQASVKAELSEECLLYLATQAPRAWLLYQTPLVYQYCRVRVEGLHHAVQVSLRAAAGHVGKAGGGDRGQGAEAAGGVGGAAVLPCSEGHGPVAGGGGETACLWWPWEGLSKALTTHTHRQWTYIHKPTRVNYFKFIRTSFHCYSPTACFTSVHCTLPLITYCACVYLNMGPTLTIYPTWVAQQIKPWTQDRLLAEHGKLLKPFEGWCWKNVCCAIVQVSCGYCSYKALIWLCKHMESTFAAREGWKSGKRGSSSRQWYQ